MLTQLSTGAISSILSGNEIENSVLQMLNMKVVQTGQHSRYRLRISDGKHLTGTCMLGTQLHHLVDKEFTPFAIFRVNRYVCNTVNDTKKVIIILDLNVLHSGEEVGGVIGSPSLYEPNQQGGTNNASSNQSEVSSRPGNFNRVPLGSLSENKVSTSAGASNVPVGVHPISSLTPYQNKWTICVRVTNKPPIRTWSNSRGQGKLFSMDLLDESGEIRATAFNEQCDKFYNMIEVDKVYYISQAQLKTANKQYSSLKNDYEITFNQGTQVTLCQQRTNIPAMQFQFVSIDQIENVERDNIVDVIGVCKDVDDVSTVVQKTTGKELKKRDVQIVDETGKEIRLTFWGSEAENFDGSLSPIVAIKGAKVSDFNGKSLSVLSSSSLQINPDIKESHKLRAWFENVGCNIQTVNLSGQRGGLGGNIDGNLKTIGEAMAENLGGSEQADYYSAKGVLVFVKKENCLYSACPSEGCNKKVIDMNNGVYRCEKCNKEYDSFNWRLMLNISVADGTDSLWATVFQDQAELLLGCTSSNLGVMREHDENGFQTVFNDAVFKEYVFKFRVKMESYNDEKRLKTTVVSVQSINCKTYNKTLLQQIKSMAGLS